FSTMESGEQCVMTCGMLQMRQWCVEKQRVMLILDKVLDKYGWMMSSVVGMNLHSKTVHHSDGDHITVVTMKMLESSAK
ncbi:hypothetical protein M9458_008834, partial [Cirrhinus mrigala]